MRGATQKKFAPKDGGLYVEKARTRWNGAAPDWVMVLAKAADEALSQGELGRKLGCSASAISAVIGNAYPGSLHEMEARVKGALMSATVECPVLGALGRDQCVDHQRRPFSAANPQRVRLWGACRQGCPHAIPGQLAKGDRKVSRP